MKFLKSLILSVAVTLTACGGGTSEATACSLPQEVKIYTDANGVIHQSLKYPGGVHTVVATGPYAAVFKEYCPGTGVQWGSFSMKTKNYFSGQGDHIVVITQGATDFYAPIIYGRGFFWRNGDGIKGEFYNRWGASIQNRCQINQTFSNSELCGFPSAPVHNLPMQDDVTYNAGFHSVPTHVAYWVNSPSGSASSVWRESDTPDAIWGKDIVFVVLCHNDCTGKPNVEVLFTNIQGGWF